MFRTENTDQGLKGSLCLIAALFLMHLFLATPLPALAQAPAAEAPAAEAPTVEATAARNPESAPVTQEEFGVINAFLNELASNNTTCIPQYQEKAGSMGIKAARVVNLVIDLQCGATKEALARLNEIQTPPEREYFINNTSRVLADHGLQILADQLLILAIPTITLADNIAEAYSILASVRMARFAPQEVSPLIDKALTIKPEHPGALKVKGDFHFMQGQFKEALEAFQKLEKVSPFPELNDMIIACHMEARDFQAAMDRADRMIKENPALPNRIELEGLKILCLFNMGRKDDAIKLSTTLRASNPDSEDLACQEAFIYFNSGDNVKAFAILDEFFGTHPKAYGVLIYQAILHINCQNPPAALEIADKAIALDPANAEAYMLKFDVLRNIGREEEAGKVITKALESVSNPEDRDRIQAIRDSLGK